MTTTQFIQISKSAKLPQFKELISLNPLNQTSELIEFCTLLHPNAAKISEGNKCEVFTSNEHYIYKMYTGCFVRTEVSNGKKKMYKHSIK